MSFNGSMVGHPTQGLRQGDPLPCYLFLICVEGLSLSPKKAASNGSISGCQITSSAPSITHLLFADDSFLLFKVTNGEAQLIKALLNSYETMFRQAVNYQKSGVFLSANVRRDKQQQMTSILGVSNPLTDTSLEKDSRQVK